MSWWGYPNSTSAPKSKQKTDEERWMSMEMCDVCTHSYPTEYIRRFQWLSPQQTHYVIRCCPYCNPQTLTQYL